MKKKILLTLVASLIFSGLLAISILLRTGLEAWNWEWDTKLLMTTFILTYCSIALFCSYELVLRRAMLFGHIGVATSVISAIYCTSLVWFTSTGDLPLQYVSALVMLTTAFAHATLLLLQLPAQQKFKRWTVHTALLANLVFSVVFLWVILGSDLELIFMKAMLFFKLLLISAIVGTTATVITYILQALQPAASKKA